LACRYKFDKELLKTIGDKFEILNNKATPSRPRKRNGAHEFPLNLKSQYKQQAALSRRRQAISHDRDHDNRESFSFQVVILLRENVPDAKRAQLNDAGHIMAGVSRLVGRRGKSPSHGSKCYAQLPFSGPNPFGSLGMKQ
jgi:hypothetical protein